MTKKLFSCDIVVYATAYVRAETAEEAAAIARDKLAGADLGFESDEIVSRRGFADPYLPDISIGPACTTAPDEELLIGKFEEVE